MKQNAKQRIGRKGENLFRLMLPDEWVPRKVDSEFGDDFHVLEAKGDDILPGGFWVQVKTKATVKTRGADIKLQLEQKDLRFWADPANVMPVFLVVVDLHTKKGYYRFMRQYLEETLKGWENTSEPTVYVPLANDISDHAAFIAAIADAKEWLRRKNSIPTAEQINTQFAEWGALDPRFRFEYVQRGGEGMVNYLATQTVQLHLQVNSEDETERADKFDRLLKKGEMVDFEPGELTVLGSRLFDSLSSDGCRAQMLVNTPITLTFRLEKDGRTLCEISQLPARLTGGHELLKIVTDRTGAPLSASISLAGDNAFKLSWDFSVWDGVKVSDAKRFVPTVQFFHDLQGADQLRLIAYHEGEEVWNKTADRAGFNIPDHDLILNLHKLHVVRKGFDINPTISLEPKHGWEPVQLLYGLLQDGVIGVEHTIDEGRTFTVGVLGSDLSRFVADYSNGYQQFCDAKDFPFHVMDLVVRRAKPTRFIIDKATVAPGFSPDSAASDEDGFVNVPMVMPEGVKVTYLVD